MDSPSFSVDQGSIYAYRIFDIGNEVDLEKATQILEQQGQVRTFRLRKSNRSLLIAEHPTVLSLSPWEESILGDHFWVSCEVKIWSFGSLSMRIGFELARSYRIEELCNISHYLENSKSFHREAVRKVEALIEILKPAIEKPGLWEQYEDYLIFKIMKTNGLDRDLGKSLMNSKITALILGEKPMEFADQVNETLTRSVYQYGKDDLVLIHWNGALIYDLEDVEDIAFTLEFALCQLLELRYYDSLLDEQLQTLYQRIEKRKSSIFSNPYGELSKKAALEYIDISEIVDRVGNAFKVIGDFYYATIYKAATEKFHIPDWRRSVDHKLSNLAQVSELFQGEIDEKRNQLMEFIIIVLITIEVIPYLYSLLGQVVGP